MFAVCVAGFLGNTACAYVPSGSCSDGSDMVAKGIETLDSLYSHYSIEGSCLLRENFPFNASFKADYLAQDDGMQGNLYSYLWPFSGTLSASKALYEATGDPVHLARIDSSVLQGLSNYRDTLRTPAAYSSYVSSAPVSDRFYDDNIWLGIDLAELYLVTGDRKYLDGSVGIWKFIESGTDSILGGGVYWCEQKKESKNTCSNAPASVFALRVFQATHDSAYLEAGRRLYGWTRSALRDPGDGLYYDNIRLDGHIGKAKYAYNSGQMLQAAAILYQVTGDSAYLGQAHEIARASYARFFDGGTAVDAKGEFKLVSPGCIWFVAVMMRGFDELDKVDGNHEYMDAYVRNLRYAWQSMRDAGTGLFNEDWSGKETKDQKWLLTQAAMVEMYANAARYINRCNNKSEK